MGCPHSGTWSVFTGVAAASCWSLSRCGHYERCGASQQLGFMINYYQDELLIDMSLETKGRLSHGNGFSSLALSFIWTRHRPPERAGSGQPAQRHLLCVLCRTMSQRCLPTESQGPATAHQRKPALEGSLYTSRLTT